MTRFMLLDRGEELSEANWRALGSGASPIRVKLLEPAPPFREGQIVQVRRDRAGARRARDLLLCREAPAFSIRSGRDSGRSDAGEILAQVVAIERGQTAVSLERGLFAHLPTSWLPRALDVLEVLRRFRHPFTPSLYLGSPEACLEGVREKYNRQAEVRAYSCLAPQELDMIEREILQRHVKPAGRILDVGCGAGREALGFARAGFQIVGIDIAPGMIEAARLNAEREGLDITFRVQSATELDEPPGSFDGAFWAGSYHHVPGHALRVDTLRRIGNALTPDGALVLMVVYRAPRGLLSRSRLVDLLRRAGARLGRIWQLSEPGDGYMRQVSEASDPREPCFFHDFSDRQEVKAELEAAGLSAEEVTPGWWVCRRALP